MSGNTYQVLYRYSIYIYITIIPTFKIKNTLKIHVLSIYLTYNIIANVHIVNK